MGSMGCCGEGFAADPSEIRSIGTAEVCVELLADGSFRESVYRSRQHGQTGVRVPGVPNVSLKIAWKLASCCRARPTFFVL